MSPSALLAQVLRLEGVIDAALFANARLEPLSETQRFAATQEVLVSCLASDRVLAELLGAETPTQTVLEFTSETVLLSLSADLAGEPGRVVALCRAEDLSRVRFGLRRLLPLLATATADVPALPDAHTG